MLTAHSICTPELSSRVAVHTWEKEEGRGSAVWRSGSIDHAVLFNEEHLHPVTSSHIQSDKWKVRQFIQFTFYPWPGAPVPLLCVVIVSILFVWEILLNSLLVHSPFEYWSKVEDPFNEFDHQIMRSRQVEVKLWGESDCFTESRDVEQAGCQGVQAGEYC